MFAVGRFNITRHNLTADSVEDIVRRTAVTCYANQGFYPPDVDYMVNCCGLQVNMDRFIIHYEIFASNIMPEIMVVEVEG